MEAEALGISAGASAATSAGKIVQLLQSIWLSSPSVSSKTSPATSGLINSSKNIVQESVTVSRSEASKTQLRRLRAAEMDYWRETGGDALRN